MKMSSLFLVLFALVPSARAQLANASPPCFISERGPHHNVWRRETVVETESGTRTNISSYTELATGLNFWNGTAYEPSRDEIEAVAD